MSDSELSDLEPKRRSKTFKMQVDKDPVLNDWEKFIEENEALIMRSLKQRAKKHKTRQQGKKGTETERKKKKRGKHNQNKDSDKGVLTINSPSENTVYQAIVKRSSEFTDSSDDALDVSQRRMNQLDLNNQVDQFISDYLIHTPMIE